MKTAKQKIQKFGSSVSAMVMPNIGVSHWMGPFNSTVY